MIDMGRTYKFEINGGNSWRRLETTLTLTCHSSLMKPPVYLDGTVVAFNLKTEQARLIPVKFPLELSSKTLFAAGDNSITLISATEKVVYFYALTNILSDRRPKWVLLKQIHNGVMDKKKLYYWNVLTYNGKCLVLSPITDYNRVVNVYHLSANKWVAMGLVPGCSIIALIDGSSSEEVENQLKKRSAEHNFLYEQSTNRKKRLV
ncbi:hypothetical protein BRARA_I03392 [Brassica rapa]|uniref:Uncharacterized protein n=1 Tax=Brassica campestris TaxID=3711 RepID=A0A397Y764_BRACM|nr:hypothetical protein BRARA_I03392 [Brassica rapa]